MGWWDDLTKPWADFWDSISGNNQRRALEQAQQQNLQTAQTQLDYQKAAMEEYLKYMREALAQQGISSRDAIAMQLLGAQIGDIVSRQNALPYQAASLSALQALPVLQSMAGLPAYALPTSFSTEVPDYVSMYNQARKVMEASESYDPFTQITRSPGGVEFTWKWNPTKKDWDYISQKDPNQLTRGTGGSGITLNQIAPVANQTQLPQTGGNFIPPGVDPNSLPTDAQGRPINPATGQIYSPTYGGAGPSMLPRAKVTVDAWGRTYPIKQSSSGDQVLTSSAPPSGNIVKLPPQAYKPTQPPDTSALFGGARKIDLIPGGEYKLTPIKPEYNFQASPLYDWQKSENTRLLRQGLSARGLLGSGAGAELENRMLSQLSANEAQNQYNRVMDIVKIGLGQAASAGNWQNQASTPINLGQQVASDLNAAAQNRSGLYQGMAGAAQSMYSNMGNIMGQAYGANNALQQQMASMPSPWMNALGTGLRLYGMYSGMGGGSPFSFGFSDIFSA